MSLDYTLVALIAERNLIDGLRDLRAYEYTEPDGFEWGGEGRWVEPTKIETIISNFKGSFGSDWLSGKVDETPTKVTLKLFGMKIVITFSKYSAMISTSAKITKSVILNIGAQYREEALIDVRSDDLQAIITILNVFKPIYARMEGDWSSFPLKSEDKLYNREEHSPFWRRDFGYTRFLGRSVFQYVQSHCGFFDRFSESLSIFTTADGGALITAKQVISEEGKKISSASIESLSNLRDCLDNFSDEEYEKLFI